MNPYETDRLLAEYLLFHYGSSEDILGLLPGPREAVGFAQRLVDELLDTVQLTPKARALDVGCAVGGSSFALSRSCESVLGVDFSSRFVSAAQELAEVGWIETQVVEQGTRSLPFTARVPEGARRERVAFAVGDAQDLPTEWADFEVVLAANLICRLPRPRDFLRQLPRLVRPGGQLLLTTPFTWMGEFTPSGEWLGGTPETGDSFGILREMLEPDFTLVAQADLPLLIREHARKFQYTVAQGSRWVRKI